MSDLPTGTVTFLFTDIQGSTNLWQSNPHKMKKALSQHDGVMRRAIESNNGWVFKTVGDAFCAAFDTAMDGVNAALASQLALRDETWDLPRSILVRMALHTGEAEEREKDYYGPALNRVARLLSTCHGGQTLLSLVSTELVRDTLPENVALKDMGEHRLKDLTRPESVFQLLHPDLPDDFPALRSLDLLPHNLPMQPTPLIGREKEIEEILKLLKDDYVHVVTLSGPGGIGKTRLGLQVAADTIEHFKHGAFFVDLSPITDPALVVSGIAQALNIREAGKRPLLDVLKDYFSDKQMLLVLDNFEQVMEAELQIVQLLSACPGLKILVTTREPLHVRGEKVFNVPPLTLPEYDKDHPTPIEQLTQYESVRLFIERAVAIRQDFTVTNENAPAVAEICIKLDGIPLAIELAAARINMLPPQAILKRLAHRLEILTHGARDLPPRQRTLRTTIDWSYELLDDKCKEFYRSLSVFAGGFTLEAAEAVCCDDSVAALDVLNGIESLLDKSLLYGEEKVEGEARFHMLETIREYGLEKLEESGEADQFNKRYSDYYLKLAQTAEPELSSSEVKRWLDKLEIEHDNFRESLRWYALGNQRESLLRLCCALGIFWQMRGYLTEGRDRLQNALLLAKKGHPILRAKGLLRICELAYYQSDYNAALKSGEECLSMSIALKDQDGEAMAYNRIGWTQYRMDNFDLATKYFIKGHDMALQINNQLALGMTALGIGLLRWREKKTDEARSLFEESLRIFSGRGELKRKAESLGNLGLITRQEGNLEKAIWYHKQAAHLEEEIGDIVTIRPTYNNLGDIYAVLGDHEKAISYYEKLQQLSQQTADDKYLNWAYAGLAESSLGLGNTDQAMEYIQKSIQLALKIGTNGDLGVSYRVLGDVMLAQGKVSEARLLFKQSISLLEEIEDQEELERAQSGFEKTASNSY